MKEKDLQFYQAGWEACEKNHAFGPAVREHYLIHYVIKGKGKYKVREEEYEIGAGEGFLICPDEVTFYQADEKEPWEYYWIGLSGKYIEEVLKICQLGKEKLVFEYKRDDRLEKVLKELYWVTKEYKVNLYEQMGYAYLFLGILSRGQEVGLSSSHEYVEKAMKFIECNYSYDISVGQVAHYVGIERTYLFRLFKKVLGLSPQEYMLQFRLEKAKEMLKHSDRSITETAYSCGFREVGYFSRCFKQYYGKSPSKYRQ